LRLAGFDVLPPQINDDYNHQQANLLANWTTRLAAIFEEQPLSFLPLSDFDTETLQLIKSDQKIGLNVGQHLGRGFVNGGMLGTK